MSQNLFQTAVNLAFENWTAFQLAVEHGFGGKTTKEKAEWFINATFEWITETGDLDEYDLQDFFEDTMDTEFNTQCEDNSAIILSRLLLNYHKMFKAGQLAELNAELAKKFPPKSSKSTASSVKAANQAGEDDSSSGSSDEEDENNNDEMCVDMNSGENHKSNKSKLEEIKESEDFQMVDDGWTFVAKAGKKLTK